MGHPNHYTVIWRDLVEDPLSWIKPFLPWQVKILATAEKYPPSKPLQSPSLRSSKEAAQRKRFSPSTLHPGPWHIYSTTRSTANSGGSFSADPGCSRGGPAHTTHSCIPDLVTTISPLRVVGPPDQNGNQSHHHCPFATSYLIIGEPKYTVLRKPEGTH